ncbi:MAG: DUF3784 domain-containing protein [Faecalibacillus sp.]
MNIWCSMCLTMSGIFLFFALLFTLLKEKSVMLISGFNSMTKEERKSYDQVRLCRDQRNDFLVWAILLGTGALLSCFVYQYLAIVFLVVWLILFFKDVHLDPKKAFSKYKKK